MDVKENFKQSELGVIPIDWNVKPLKNICSMKSGKSITSKDINNFSDYPCYGGNGIRGFTYSFTHEGNFALIGRQGALCGNIVGVSSRFFASEHAIVVTANNNTSINWLEFVLRRMNLNKYSESSAQPGLSVSKLLDLSVSTPTSFVEQNAIAMALSDTDALIESLEKLIEKKRQIKQGAMQELLTGKKRLPGFSGEWEEITLINIAEGKKELFDDGDWIEAEHITNQGVRLIQTGNIGIGKFTETSLKKYIYPSSLLSLKCKELIEGDLLICRLADPAGRACVLPNIGEEKTVTSVDVTIFRPPKLTTNRMFLAQLFSTKSWFDTISDRCGGTTHKRISRGALGQIKIKLPKIAEQNAIAEILTEIDLEITELESKLNKARQIKQGMMQELLTGRIRLV